MPRFPPLSLGSGHVPKQRLVIKPTYLSILICMGKCLSSEAFSKMVNPNEFVNRKEETSLFGHVSENLNLNVK